VIAPIFISYSSIDQKVAESICDALQARGYGCWIACRNVMPGENFQEAIVKAIRSAKVMLLVFTSNANNSDEIKKEVVLAGRHRIVVVPLRVEDVAPNDALAYEFATRQWIDLFKDWEREIERLASLIGSILAVSAPERDTAAVIPQQLVSKIPAPAAAKSSPLRPMVLLGALVIIALGSGGAYLYRQMAAAPANSETKPTAAPPSADPLRRDLVTDCDRLAANPLDPQRPTGVEGVTPDHIDIVPALAACNDAVRKYPDVARFLYQSGRVAEAQEDYAEARRWYEKAAAAGEAQGMINLGSLYEAGNGVPQDYAAARRWYEKAAATGNAWAMINLGIMYGTGHGVPQDDAAARRWYEKAGATGDAGAMNALGLFYLAGVLGVPKDVAAARSWYEKAAAAGNAGAMTELGLFYEYGSGGLSRDYAAARRWYEKAAAAGEAGGTNALGVLYATGHGVPQDYATARRWYEKAAAAGSDLAMRNLGDLYREGHGVPQDYATARSWFEKAAAAGNAGAMTELGWLYANGNGVPQDYAAARRWYEKAVAAGDTTAKDRLANLKEPFVAP
jgi:TPR repeat protein